MDIYIRYVSISISTTEKLRNVTYYPDTDMVHTEFVFTTSEWSSILEHVEKIKKNLTSV